MRVPEAESHLRLHWTFHVQAQLLYNERDISTGPPAYCGADGWPYLSFLAKMKVCVAKCFHAFGRFVTFATPKTILLMPEKGRICNLLTHASWCVLSGADAVADATPLPELLLDVANRQFGQSRVPQALHRA